MNTAVMTFQRLLIKQERKYGKEILVGLVLLAVSVIAYLIRPEVGNLLVITYLFITSIAGFVKNDVFWSAEDFRSLNIPVGSARYFVFYLLQRFWLDSVVSNLIVGVGLTVFLLLRGQMFSAVTFLIYATLYFGISPACSIVCSKRNKAVTALCVVFLVAVPVVLWLDFAFWHKMTALYAGAAAADGLWCLGFSLACFGLFTLVARVCKGQKSRTYPPRILLSPLKKLDLWVYKEYLLNYKMILGNVFSLALTLLLFAETDDLGILKAFLLWVTCGHSFFSGREKKTKEFTLLANDPLFCGRAGADGLFLRRKKFKAVLTGSVIRFAVALPFLIAMGLASVETVSVFAVTGLISALLECYGLFHGSWKARMLIHFAQSTVPVLWGAVLLTGYPTTFLWIYLVVALLISAVLFAGMTVKNRAEDPSAVL